MFFGLNVMIWWYWYLSRLTAWLKTRPCHTGLVTYNNFSNKYLIHFKFLNNCKWLKYSYQARLCREQCEIISAIKSHLATEFSDGTLILGNRCDKLCMTIEYIPQDWDYVIIINQYAMMELTSRYWTLDNDHNWNLRVLFLDFRTCTKFKFVSHICFTQAKAKPINCMFHTSKC